MYFVESGVASIRIQNQVYHAGSEIVTDWLPMRPKIKCWQTEF